jgi:hypothetical protein
VPRTRLRGRRIGELVSSLAVIRDDELTDLVRDASAMALLDAITEAPDAEDDRLVALAAAADEIEFDTLAEWRHRRRTPMFLAAAAVLVVALIASLVLYHPGNSGRANASVEVSLGTRGGAVFEAVVPNRSVVHGHVELAALPLYVPLVVVNQIVGVISSADLSAAPTLNSLPAGQVCGSGGTAVYGYSEGSGSSDGQLVGHLYPVAGYVALGSTPNCGPSGATSTTIISNPPCGIAVTGAKVVLGKQCGSNSGSSSPTTSSGNTGPSGNSGAGGNSGGG